MKRLLILVVVGLVGCSKGGAGSKGDAGALARRGAQRAESPPGAGTAPVVAGGAPGAGTAPVVAGGAGAPLGAGTALAFAAPEWRRVACTDVKPDDGCASQWVHETGQVARVFVLHADARALPGFVDKLAAGVKQRGGVVDPIPGGVRFLEQVGDHASLNYALVGPGAVHLVTSVVPLADQRSDDERLRKLLDTARWE